MKREVEWSGVHLSESEPFVSPHYRAQVETSDIDNCPVTNQLSGVTCVAIDSRLPPLGAWLLHVK